MLIAALSAISMAFLPSIQAVAEALFDSEDRLDWLRSVFLTLGGALTGAAAIVSSLVLFAMQVNIERMPHGLFRRLSGDARLLAAFTLTFLIPIGITSLALSTRPTSVGIAILLAAWGTLATLSLFLYCYRRALLLVNPVRQIEMIVQHTRRDLRAWVRRAERAAPLIQSSRREPNVQHDLRRTAYFQMNPHWTANAMQGVRHAVSLARRYAEQGDHEVSGSALTSVVVINAAYVDAKGKTFFAQSPFLDNPFVTDRFINDTLEHLRKIARAAIARGDEIEIEQTYRAIAGLVRVYLAIDYADPHAPKTHAHLAAAYLAGAVEQTAPHQMVDVLMEGLRLLGRCASLFLSAEGPQGPSILIEKIGPLTCVGIAREDHRPITQTGVEQLAHLSLELLRTRAAREVGHLAESIRASVIMIGELVLTIPDSPLQSIHSSLLSPYYSATTEQSLLHRTAELINAAVTAQQDDQDAREVINNLADWADGIYRHEKRLLLQAIQHQSHLTFDLLNWITSLTTILLAASNAPACSDHTRDELRRHARWLVAVLSWVPEDEKSVRFVENYELTEKLFTATIDARTRGCSDIADDIEGMLLSWAFKAGAIENGWGILERAVYGLSTLAVLKDDERAVDHLKASLAARVGAGELPDAGVRDRTAIEVRGRAARLYREGHWSSGIQRTMAQADHGRLQPLLEEIADIISPTTRGQAARHAFP